MLFYIEDTWLSDWDLSSDVQCLVMVGCRFTLRTDN